MTLVFQTIFLIKSGHKQPPAEGGTRRQGGQNMCQLQSDLSCGLSLVRPNGKLSCTNYVRITLVFPPYRGEEV